MPRAPITFFCLVLAAPCAQARALAPGKPAGIQAAQHVTYRQFFIGASIIAVALTFGLPSSGTGTTATSAATTS
jgi:hypothetical protein